MKSSNESAASRRLFLKNVPLALTAAAGVGLLARTASASAVCEATPRQAKGPFYPVVNQLDKDTDLTLVAGRSAQALGRVVWVTGVVRDTNCSPVEGALVEIWQACATGRYDHPNDPNTAALDPNFQYWGRSMTDKDGNYRFKTIIPGAYPADVGWVRPPHIHFRVMKRGFHELITQMYFAGEELNSTDRILMSLPESERNTVVVNFKAEPGVSDPVGAFDIQIRQVAVR